MQSSLVAPAYLDPKQSICDRVADLLSRMTVAEKVAQMTGVWNEKNSKLLNSAGDFDPALADQHFGHGNGIGQIGRPSDAEGGAKPGKPPRESAELANAMQRWFIENSRLGIPVLFHDECLHGHVAVGATSFPQPIGLGATFNPDLVQRLYRMTALEARSRGIHQALGPVLDVARDPRWGRVEETFGEDPHLAAELGSAAVRGLQDQLSNGRGLIATLKHFAAHGQPESGTNCAPVSISERHLRETFLQPFLRAIRDGGAKSVMASYNEIDGVPSHANTWLLRDVLRDEWGFEGYVVSDYYAIRELAERPDLYGHHVAKDGKAAAALAVAAGVNIELPEPDCYALLVDAVEEGLVDESQLDELVAPLLAAKFELGLFENPYVDVDRVETIVESSAHRDLALEAARQTITLLENDGVLPLDASKLSTIAVIGPNADRPLLGGYSGRPRHVSSVLSGVRQRVGSAIEVLYHEGCRITQDGSWWQDEVVACDPETERLRIAEAVEVAKRADVVVLVVGGNEQTSREAWSSKHMGDRTNLQMVGLQDELAAAIAATGKPVISVLSNGRPLEVSQLASNSRALLECWYLGQEGGRAVAEVLFGDFSPGGKLPISIPRSVVHLPAYYNYRPSARRGYLFDEVTPLYPFGYGLSYTTFEFSEPRLSEATIHCDGSTIVSVDVTNTGEREGDEVVQLYIRDLVSSATRPVKELKGFQRVTLAPGETRTVSIPITSDSLAFWNVRKKYVVEPGEFDVMVGPNSADLKNVRLTVASGC
ncbi:glycoside hydrolase family 3 N-terminal domain-containing protein [Aeoliella sp. SH292]|uniref:glycoside hydrolase family 3 N-terminal domain-containing protein n=1 Tax=Aeoliella sp. SH292 TaxID=3454464 RepID=UPI003F97987C